MAELDDGWLATASTRELLSGYASILRKLRDSNVIRSNNAPVGDYAEYLAVEALGGTPADNFSTKSYDLTCERWGKVQVKARLVADVPEAGQLRTSPFRSNNFDHAGLILCRAQDYSVRRAVLLPVDVAMALWRWSGHVRGHVLPLTGAILDHPWRAADLTAEFVEAARRAP